MRRAIAAPVVFAFAAAFVQSPWLHIHVRGSDPDHMRQHARWDVVHGHGLDRSEASPQWRDDSADEDARSLGPLTALRVSVITPDLKLEPVNAVAEPALMAAVRPADGLPRVHGPPDRSTLPSRAPPA